MNKLRNIVLGIALLMCMGSLAMADQNNNVLKPQQNKISQQKAVNIAQKKFKGRVLAIHHTDNAYRVKILSAPGSVHIVLVNDTDGSIISAR